MRIFFVLVVLICVAGCSTMSSQQKREVLRKEQEATSALKAVAGGLSGTEVKDEDLKNLAQRMQKDKEAQSAVKTLTNTVASSEVAVKYCPVDGKRFSGRLMECPEHHVKLIPVE